MNVKTENKNKQMAYGLLLYRLSMNQSLHSKTTVREGTKGKYLI